MPPASLLHRAGKPLVFLLCLGPLLYAVWLGFTGGLGVNPIEFLNRYLGDWAMRMILIGLAITPIRLVTGWGGLLRFRRMVGLFAFFYVFLHLTNYVAVDQFFNWKIIWQDILKRNYITIGMIAVTLLIPLAVTSNNASIRKLGSKAWQNLHRLIYIVGPLVIVHFYMMVKADVREPLIYGAILALLLGIRVVYAVKRRIERNRRQAATG